LTMIQKELLGAAHRHVRKGGILIYSTCSILQEENDDIVTVFLQNHPEYKIDHASQFVKKNVVDEPGWIKTWPDVHQTDGSFAVRLKKGG